MRQALSPFQAERYCTAAGVLHARCSRYKYASFGQTIAATCPLPRDNRFLFSTTFADDEPSLDYYGYRYYKPNLGRWPFRDPLEEHRGVNLYGWCGNYACDNGNSGTDKQ